ncbi:hypothetical protein S100390_v1c05860 [Spiroplasma sp. NBRC 100390]|nr:hypothetical protein STU14_v1c05860 [Spiroplasma sp. TU-14]APE13393.1 hypothetical protein S100390_v1c05860 [Spiroplasma sp. NBRC 100390]
MQQIGQRSLKIKYCFYVIFAIIPLFCVLLDLFFSTIQPDPQYGDATRNFDFSIINQSIYLSVWVALATAGYGILNWIHYHTKNMPDWITGKNNLTRITTLNVISFIVFNTTLLISPTNVVGFNTWYKILKSVLEHMLVPIIVIVYYFLFTTKSVGTKQYCKKYSWYNLILIIFYLLYVSVRGIMLVNFISEGQKAFTPFPYDQLNPFEVGFPIFFVGIISLLIIVVGLAIILNYLSNLRNKKGKVL